jgi:ATP-dependent Lon protease
MSEAFERVRGVKELPLFPLPVVLFPGVPMPLHIFEERYRRLLRDISLGKRLFGLSFFDAETSSLGMPPVGHVGCVAEVTEVQPLPDGRSNILTVGLIRYRVESYVEHGDPYLVGEVKFFEDEPEDDNVLRERAAEVAETFMRIARAVRTISDERTPLPELPADEPERLSFLMAGAIDLENDIKLELLKLRSTSTRLDRLREFLSSAVDNYEERARMHSIAKRNGHGGRKIELE